MPWKAGRQLVPARGQAAFEEARRLVHRLAQHVAPVRRKAYAYQDDRSARGAEAPGQSLAPRQQFLAADGAERVGDDQVLQIDQDEGGKLWLEFNHVWGSGYGESAFDESPKKMPWGLREGSFARNTHKIIL